MIYDWDTNNISLAIIKIEEEIETEECGLRIMRLTDEIEEYQEELEEIENEQ